MLNVDKGSWSARHLDPGSHMGEILFGLIMTLTFTLGAGIVIQEEGRAGDSRCSPVPSDNGRARRQWAR